MGPNLNMLGLRDPEKYGSFTLKDIENLCVDTAKKLEMNIDFRQSNHEGELVTWIQEARGQFDGLMINAGAYTHTSIAIHDALEIFDGLIIEVHQSEPLKREKFRHISYITPQANCVISGLKEQSYVKGLEKLADILQ